MCRSHHIKAKTQNNRKTAMLITTDDVQTFANDGVIVLRKIIPTEWLLRIADSIDRDIANPAPFVHGYKANNGKGQFHGNLRTWETDPNLRDFCLHSSLPELAAIILGSSRINLFYDQLFVKEPGTPNPTRWHNDQPYWPIRGRDILSFWISPDPVTKESGALEFIRGSHKWRKMFQPERFGDTAAHSDYERNPDYLDMPDVDATRENYDIVTWDLEPGDAYIFHAMTVHGSLGNLRKDVRRRGYTVRYIGNDVLYDRRPGTNEHLRNASYCDGDRLDGPLNPQVWPK